MEPWFVKWPERLEREFQALDELGAVWEEDREAREAGLIRLRLRVANPEGGDGLDLVAAFPEAYPYFRPEVLASGITLPRHQNPASKNLCLLARGTQHWDTDQTLAGLLRVQLPEVLRAGQVTDPAAIAADPAEQGEPVSTYYEYVAGAFALIDGAWAIPEGVERGLLTLGLREGGGLPLQAAVLEMKDAEDHVIARAPESVTAIFTHHHRAHWVRVASAPHAFSAVEFDEWMRTERLIRSQSKTTVKGGIIENVTAIIFPDEVGAGREKDGWVFAVITRKPGHLGGGNVPKPHLTPAFRYGSEDALERAPELAPLRVKKVAVVGLGCVGAPSALEFARAGIGQLRMLDHDTVDPATTLRWPMGLWAAGMPKADGVAQFIKQNYPHTVVRPFRRRLGAPPFNAAEVEEKSEASDLARLLDDADLLYDSAAELGLQYYLSELAHERGLAYVAAYGSAGGWGGVVLRVVPGRTEGCWTCLQHHLMAGTIVAPPADPAGTVQPEGCADPTFTGAGFDLVQVALSGVRLAVATLCQGQAGAYPDMDWDVGVLALRDSTGRPIAPLWTTYPLSRHPACVSCATR